MDAFEARTAVITGAASGIGAGLAKALAARGTNLVLADIDSVNLAATVSELEELGANVIGVETDVRDPEAVDALADATDTHFGATHILCNNAGVATLGPLATAPLTDWTFVLDVDLWGVVHGIHAFVPRMVARGEGGHIVNTASMAGLVGMVGLGIYSTAKFAVVGLSEALRRELKPAGIGVSVLCPMIVDTAINQHSAQLKAATDGGPIPDVPAMVEIQGLVGGTQTVDEVTCRVIDAVEANELYILTHPEQREILERRAGHLAAAAAAL